MKSMLLAAAGLVFGATVCSAQANVDSTKAQTNDSLPRQGTDTAQSAAKDTSAAQRPVATESAPARAAAPVDSILLTACRGALAGRPAPGLLTVVFRAGTPDTARAAAAKAVSGALVVTTTGEEYVQLSPESGPLPVAAARLIQLPPVTSVSEKSCP